MTGQWLACTMVIAGCAGEPAPERAPVPQGLPPVAPVTTGPTTLPAPPAEDGVRIVLLDPGREPRRPLRYRPAIGMQQTLALDTRIDMSMSSDGHLMFGQHSDTKGKIALRVERVDGDKIEIALTVITMEMPTYDPTDFVKPASIDGQGGTITITDRGKLVETRLPFLESSDTARDWLQLADYLVLLPEEPVGAGARWAVHSVSQRNGIGMRSVDTHELVELTATALRTRSTIEQDSWPQRVTTFAEDPITVFEVSTFKSTGASELEVALDRPMPRSANSNFEFTTEMSIRRPGGSQGIVMTMKADMHTTEVAGGGRP